jgi:hypothetical protein
MVALAELGGDLHGLVTMVVIISFWHLVKDGAQITEHDKNQNAL